MRARWSDHFRFIGKLNLFKIWNVGALYFSFIATKWFKKPIQWGTPMTVSIEPTTACNLRCPECPSGLRSFTRPTGNLKIDFFRKCMDELAHRLCYLIFYFQGEPYINPDFLKMVKHAEEKGIYTISSTNGHFLSEENAKKTVESGLSRLIISVDGTTQEVYEQYRKEGKLSNVLEGAKNVVKWKKKLNSSTPYLIFQFLVVKPNEQQIPDIFEIAKDIGIDEVKLKTAQIYDYKFGNPLIPSIDKYSRYKKQSDGTFSLKNALLNQCWKLWHACVITWDGKVVPCCFDKDATHQLGNIQETKIKDVWKNQAYNGFRKALLTNRQ